ASVRTVSAGRPARREAAGAVLDAGELRPADGGRAGAGSRDGRDSGDGAVPQPVRDGCDRRGRGLTCRLGTGPVGQDPPNPTPCPTQWGRGRKKGRPSSGKPDQNRRLCTSLPPCGGEVGERGAAEPTGEGAEHQPGSRSGARSAMAVRAGSGAHAAV